MIYPLRYPQREPLDSASRYCVFKMADSQQLALIRQGPKPWNQWRETNGALTLPDLSGANLSGANLSGANLYRTNFGEAGLSGGGPQRGEAH
jgi:uncharacterized protein YjbI with pentapeptide repeats